MKITRETIRIGGRKAELMKRMETKDKKEVKKTDNRGPRERRKDK
jgi:hypothetical protein